MSAVYAWVLPETVSNQRVMIICMVCEQLAVNGRSVAAITNKKLPYALQLEASPLRLLTLHSDSSSPTLPLPIDSASKSTRPTFNFREKFTRI